MSIIICGLMITMINAATIRLKMGKFRRPKRMAIKFKEPIIPARTTEALGPTKRIKIIMAKIEKKLLFCFPKRLNRRLKKEISMVMLVPERAII